MTDQGLPDPETSPRAAGQGGTDPDDVADLLAAYALDAVDDDERARVEALLAVDPQARAEVARFEDAAAALAADDGPVEPPAGTWAAIQARIATSSRPVLGAPAPAGSGPGDDPGTGGTDDAGSDAAGRDDRGTDGAGTDDAATDDESLAAVVPLGDRRARPRPGPRPRRAWRIVAIAAAVVVLVVAAAAVLRLSRTSDSRSSELVEALQAPTTRIGYLSGSAGEAKVVLTADGSGFLTTGGLAPPADGKVYQLWLGDSGTMVSLGVVEDTGISRFDAPADSRGLALSLEERPGAAQPTLPPVATGQLA